MKEITECIGDIGDIGHTNSDIFTMLDLTSELLQVKLDIESHKLTAFTILGKGQFHWITSDWLLCLLSKTYGRRVERHQQHPHLDLWPCVHRSTWKALGLCLIRCSHDSTWKTVYSTTQDIYSIGHSPGHPRTQEYNGEFDASKQFKELIQIKLTEAHWTFT